MGVDFATLEQFVVSPAVQWAVLYFMFNVSLFYGYTSGSGLVQVLFLVRKNKLRTLAFLGLLAACAVIARFVVQSLLPPAVHGLDDLPIVRMSSLLINEDSVFAEHADVTHLTCLVLGVGFHFWAETQRDGKRLIVWMLAVFCAATWFWFYAILYRMVAVLAAVGVPAMPVPQDVTLSLGDAFLLAITHTLSFCAGRLLHDDYKYHGFAKSSDIEFVKRYTTVCGTLAITPILVEHALTGFGLDVGPRNMMQLKAVMLPVVFILMMGHSATSVLMAALWLLPSWPWMAVLVNEGHALDSVRRALHMTLEEEEVFMLNVSKGIVTIGAVISVWLVLSPAPYGRHTEGSSWLYGMHVPGRVAWVTQEAPCAVWFAVALGSGTERLANPANKLLLLLFGLHYVNRTFVFPMRLKACKPTPLVVWILAFMYCLTNGYLQCRSQATFNHLPDDWVYDPRFIAGIALFFVGMSINWHADHILINLRKPGETGYKIPKGGMYEYVSAPNYFGEGLEWLGYSLASWSWIPLSFALFTMFNTFPRGHQHHLWYQRKFPEYPKRKAVVPFVW